MIAGLPNDIRKITLFVLVSTILLVFALPGLAEDVQTPSTTLDDVLTFVTQNDYLSPTQQTLLTSSLTSAVTSGALTVDQALALVDLSGLEDVTDAAETPVVTRVLSIILDALASGEISPEQASTYMADTVESGTLSTLKDLTQAETPMGIENSISNLGGSEGYEQEAIDTVLAKVDELVAAGVPSGIALRVVKDLLGAGLDPEKIIAELDGLETSIADAGTSPGKAANEVAPKGQNQEEVNQNTNQGKNDEPENEDKENQNGSSGNGKSSGSPENENSNNSTNGSAGNGNNGGDGSNGNSGNAGTKGGKG
ncbi:MAG: hypothetical protein U9Q94_08615 [Candidatus Bipolaricaulota bacterium]|nr:hypothetical protein [Candidatus Bipolaricaulota bacterium]